MTPGDMLASLLDKGLKPAFETCLDRGFIRLIGFRFHALKFQMFRLNLFLHHHVIGLDGLNKFQLVLYLILRFVACAKAALRADARFAACEMIMSSRAISAIELHSPLCFNILCKNLDLL